MVNFGVDNYTPYLGALFAILTTFLCFITSITKKDKKLKKNTNMVNIALNILKCTLLVIIFAIFCINTDILNIVNANAIFGISLFFYILNFELVIRFIARGRDEKALYEPFLIFKIPIQTTLAFAILFLCIWSKNIPSIILSIVFCVIHIAMSYNYYSKNIKEEKEKNINK